MKYVIIYLVAVVLANLSVTWFGPNSIIINAFLFIGLDLTSRDKLHETWQKDHLVMKMTLLILSGSVISWLLNQDSARIAIASFIGFAASATTDTIVYALLYKKSMKTKINGSNFFSAAVDSIVFPTIAFGSIMPLLSLGQFVAKVIGGYIWSLILVKAPHQVNVSQTVIQSEQ